MTRDPKYKWTAFISYSRSVPDAWLAKQVFDLLTAQSIPVWMDRARIGVGDDFHEEIVAALERSRVVICIVSPDSIKSDWCKSEWFYGRATAHVLPIVRDLDFDKLPFGIDAKQALKLEPSWTQEQLVLLHAKIRLFELTNPEPRKRAGTPNSIAELLEEASQWPLLTVGREKGVARIKAAEQLLLSLPHAEQLVRAYNNPHETVRSLRDLKSALDRPDTTSETWRAFANLAAPFDRRYRILGMKKAKSKPEEFRAELGTTPEEIEAAYYNALEQVEQRSEEYEQTYRPTVEAAVRRIGEQEASESPLGVAGGSAELNATNMPDGEPAEGRDLFKLIMQLILGAAVVGTLAAATTIVGAKFGWWEGWPPSNDGGPPPPPPPPPPTPPSPPKLRYCDYNLRCRFEGGGYSFAQVSKDCYGNESMTDALWQFNKNKPHFRGGDPDEVWPEFEFDLPRACDHLDQSKAE